MFISRWFKKRHIYIEAPLQGINSLASYSFFETFKLSTISHRIHPAIESSSHRIHRWDKEHGAPPKSSSHRIHSMGKRAHSTTEIIQTSNSFDGIKSTKQHRIHSMGKRARSTIEFIQQ
jgi:hypothetical protein